VLFPAAVVADAGFVLKLKSLTTSVKTVLRVCPEFVPLTVTV
jgi:hypothetical protein